MFSRHTPPLVVWFLPFFHLCALHVFSATLNVHDFGATGDGTTDDGPAINKAISESIKQGPGGIVLIPAGNYFLKNPAQGSSGHILIDHGDGLTLQGEPKTILISGNADVHELELKNCKNVSVKMLNLDRSIRQFTQGTIQSVDLKAKTYTVMIDAGYEEPDGPVIQKLSTLRIFTYPAAETYQHDRWWPHIVTREKVGDRTWKLTMDNEPDPNANGARFFLWDDRKFGHAFTGSDNTDTLFEDVNYWARGANGALFMNGSLGVTTFRRVNFEVPPNSGDLLASSGGGQMFNTRGSLVFEDCNISKVDDDGADLLTTYVRILAKNPNGSLLLQGNDGFQVGDKVAIMDWYAKKEKAWATITNVDSRAGGGCVITLDQSVDVQHTGPGPAGDDRNKSKTDGIDRVIDYNLACTSLTIRNCHIQAFRARGLNLKAQNTLIENCTFHGCEMPACSGGAEMYWGEAPAVHNFTVRNCHFINCNSINVDVGYYDAGMSSVSRDNKNILIEGNTFDNYGAHSSVLQMVPGIAVRVRFAQGVIIRNNDFTNRAPGVSEKVPKVLVQQCDDVTIENNRGLEPELVKLPADNVPNETP